MRAHDFEQLEMFQAAASEAFVPLRIDVPEDVGFRATFGSKKINELPITTIAGAACSVRRDARAIGSTDPELVKVALHRRGLAGVEQDGRQCLLNPGDLVAYATTRPYELRYWDDFETTVIAIPRSRLGLGAELVGQRSAVRLPVGPGVSSVVSACLTGLAGSLGDVSGAAAMYLADALVSLVVSAFTEGSADRDEPTSHLADRILAYSLANLADPGLSVESVARRHGISVRYLHKVIARRGTSLAAWIRRERLQRIHRDISNPALANRTTTEIAARWGILDPAHLGRSLKSEFGRTVTDIRRGLARRDRGEHGLAFLPEQAEAFLSGRADVGRIGLLGAEQRGHRCGHDLLGVLDADPAQPGCAGGRSRKPVMRAWSA